MKTRTILASMLAVAALAGCSQEHDDYTKPVDAASAAYLSVNFDTEKETRSNEHEGANESDLKTLYLITFDDTGIVVGVPDSSDFFTEVLSGTATPEPILVSSNATRLLVIANPGTALKGVIEDINGTTTFTTVNAAIEGVKTPEITDNVDNITKGFAMINSGDETGKNAGDKITDPLIRITDNIKKLKDYADEAAAIKAAKENPVKIKVERYASKVKLVLKDDIEVLPEGAKFTFGSWTLDALNSAFFPFAEKTLLEVAHTTQGSYVKNFYTKDPNYDGAVGEGMDYTKINSKTFAPELVTPYTWMTADKQTYCIENTMAAPEQRFGNATRVVIKGTYYPEGFDGVANWFNFAGRNYASLADLKARYDLEGEDSNLGKVCKKMYDKIKAYAVANGKTIDGTDFKSLSEEDLAKVENGGEVIKDGKNDVIRWYQKGLCYYYYEIRHDNKTTEELGYAKYGVVRNNWYSLTLGSVKGPGTPWYPDIENPGPGDPGPEKPIDDSKGYLGITVEVQKWIIWESEIGI
ncbi:Mfa1 family fimbria major subunit [uncultured Alistipes sp.]|uniref:Mfa1 family fimbria major subunit n=1 Tax=uncultured Alistipes sp. TaxID=538949 RepID=UPI002600BCD4|nr:Mfa1 family fimbria major subunit [uncultured Alistipes sp.]